MKLKHLSLLMAGWFVTTASPSLAAPFSWMDPSAPVLESLQTGPSMIRVDAKDLPAVAPEGDLASFRLALERQLEQCRKEDSGATWKFGDRTVARKAWCIQTGEAFLKFARESSDLAEVFQKARAQFEWYRSTGRDGKGEVMYTGYYFPHLEGARDQSNSYAFPLYRLPPELVQIEIDGKKVWRRRNSDGTYSMFYDRREIDVEGKLRGRKLEIAHVEDLFEAFILHVQGSGAVWLNQPNGKRERIIVNYAGQNGHAYTSIRKILQGQGVDPEYLTLQGMRKYFASHPGELVPVLSQSPSYIFFQEAQTGPYGSAGTILVPGHSVAVDRAVFPMGALGLIKTTRPKQSAQGDVEWVDFSRIVVTQDTGGAIKGPGRVDIFWGEDGYAEFAAGQMSQLGELYFAVVK